MRSATALTDFLLADSVPDTLDAGFAVRRKVLGDAHVDRAIAGTTEFTREFQALITRYAWGTVWTRPGLDERTRRLLVLATAAALGRWEGVSACTFRRRCGMGWSRPRSKKFCCRPQFMPGFRPPILGST